MKLKQIFKPIPLNKELSWCIFPFYFLCFSCCIPQQQQSRSTSVGWAASFQSWVQWMTHALFNQTPNALCCKTDEELLRKWAERKCKMEKSHQVVIFYPPHAWSFEETLALALAPCWVPPLRVEALFCPCWRRGFGQDDTQKDAAWQRWAQQGEGAWLKRGEEISSVSMCERVYHFVGEKL